MRGELAKGKTARHILKKALAYFAADPKQSTVLPLGTAAYGLRAQCARLGERIIQDSHRSFFAACRYAKNGMI